MLFQNQTEFETAQACLSLLFWLRSLSFNSELRSSRTHQPNRVFFRGHDTITHVRRARYLTVLESPSSSRAEKMDHDITASDFNLGWCDTLVTTIKAIRRRAGDQTVSVDTAEVEIVRSC